MHEGPLLTWHLVKSCRHPYSLKAFLLLHFSPLERQVLCKDSILDLERSTPWSIHCPIVFHLLSWILFLKKNFSLERRKTDFWTIWEIKASQWYFLKGAALCYQLLFLKFWKSVEDSFGHLLVLGCILISLLYSSSPLDSEGKLKCGGLGFINNCRVDFVLFGGHLPCYLLCFSSLCHPSAGLIGKWIWLWLINHFSYLKSHSPRHFSTVQQAVVFVALEMCLIFLYYSEAIWVHVYAVQNQNS